MLEGTQAGDERTHHTKRSYYPDPNLDTHPGCVIPNAIMTMKTKDDIIGSKKNQGAKYEMVHAVSRIPT